MFVYTIVEILTILSNLEPSAQPKLKQAYYVFQSKSSADLSLRIALATKSWLS